MCGILATNDEEHFKNHYSAIFERGQIHRRYFIGGVDCLQSVLSIRVPYDPIYDVKLKSAGLAVLYNGEIYCKEPSDTEFIYRVILNKFENREDLNQKVENLNVSSNFSQDMPEEDNKNSQSLSNSDISPQDENEVNIFMDKIQSIFHTLGNYEGEYALLIFDVKTEKIAFFTDNIGRKSLGFTIQPNPESEKSDRFYVASNLFDTAVNPSYFYCFDMRRNRLFFRHKILNSKLRTDIENIPKENDYLYRKSIMDKPYIWPSKIENLEEIEDFSVKMQKQAIDLLKKSAENKTHDLRDRDIITIAFSGGIDSFVTVLLLDKIFKTETVFVLITTYFTESSFDYQKAKENREELRKRLKRKFKFEDKLKTVEDANLSISTVESQAEKERKMDLNIGIVHNITSSTASQVSNVLFNGNAADELFIGYKKYCRGLKPTEFAINFSLIKSDLMNIHLNNIFRDDRVISHNKVEMRSLFLDESLFSFIFSLLNFLEKQNKTVLIGERETIKSENGTKSNSTLNRDEGERDTVGSIIFKKIFADPLENKKTLRNFLRDSGFAEQSKLPKKAMQFGSGLKSIEDQVNYKTKKR